MERWAILLRIVGISLLVSLPATTIVTSCLHVRATKHLRQLEEECKANTNLSETKNGTKKQCP